MNETSFFLSKHCNEIIERETEKDWMDENIELTIDASWKGSYKKIEWYNKNRFAKKMKDSKIINKNGFYSKIWFIFQIESKNEVILAIIISSNDW